MIRLVLIVALLGIAMLLGPVLANHPGYVMIVVAGVTLEATFIGLMLLLLLSFASLWLLSWLLRKLFNISHISFGFLRSRKEKKALQALQQGSLAFIRQDWQRAEQLLVLAAKDTEFEKNRQLMACYSAQRAGSFDNAQQLLSQLDQDDADTWLVTADVLLQQNQAERAIVYLADKVQAQPKLKDLGQLWLKALQQAGRWQQLLEQVPLALKYQWWTRPEWQQMRYQIYPAAISGLAALGQFDESASFWSQLPAKERKSVAATLGKAWAKAVAGQPEVAEKMLLDTLVLADVVLAWPVIQHIPLGRSVLQLRKQVQHWLRDHSNHGYLYALLSYCAAQEAESSQAAASWQKALQYQPALALQTPPVVRG